MSDHGLQDGTQVVASGDGITFWASGVKLTRVEELSVLMDDEDVGGTSSMPGVGHGLRGIDQVRELPATRLSKGRHFFRRVIWVLGGIVRIDRDKGNSFGHILRGKSAERIPNMDDVGTVIAGKNNHQRFSIGAIGLRPSFPMGVWQRKIRGEAA